MKQWKLEKSNPKEINCDKRCHFWDFCTKHKVFGMYHLISVSKEEELGKIFADCGDANYNKIIVFEPTRLLKKRRF